RPGPGGRRRRDDLIDPRVQPDRRGGSTMSDTTTAPDLAAFRAETRAWLEANCPPEMRRPMATEEDICWGGKRYTFQSDAQRLWLQRMGERGWTVPTWPGEYGGGGLDADRA